MTCSKCGATLTSTSGFCPRCGQPIVGFSVGQATAPSSSASTPGLAPAASASAAPATVQTGVGYAGFWLRFVAAILDGIILGVPLTPILLILLLPAFGTFKTPKHSRIPGR